MIKAVLFDFYGTLVEGRLDREGFCRDVVDFLRGRGYQVSVEEYRGAVNRVMEDVWRIRASMREKPFEEIQSEALTLMNIESDMEVLDRIYEVYYGSYAWSLMPGLKDVVWRLSRRYRLGVVSNTTSRNPFIVLEESNLLRHFGSVVLSRDVGIRKPHPEIFEHALRSLQVEPGETVFVGDSYASDVLGANKAGIRAIWLNVGRASPSRVEADAVVTSLWEIPALIEDWVD